jgi:hypothetical protein
LARHGAIATAVIAGALFIGMLGYHYLEKNIDWLDAFLNASMILGGMGPVSELHTSGGKLFAGCYAIFSGVVFLTTVAILFAPVLHRFLHRMHLDIESPPDQNEQRP